jgi:peroxiredoxin
VPTAPVGSQGDIPAVDMGLAPGTDAPAFDVVDTEGGQHRLAAMKGSVVVLEFWGSMFPASSANFAEIEELSGQFKDKGVKFMSLAARESDDTTAAELFRSSGATYPLVPKGDALVNDYKVLGFPSYAVISGDGKITSFFQSYPGRTQLADAVTAAMNAGK